MTEKGGAPRWQRGRLPRLLQVISRYLPRNRPHPANPCLQSSPSRHGYAARRGSQAGSALSVREGRVPSSKGPAENGLPPATRGKWRGIGPTPSFTLRTARRMCLCGTQGGWTGGCVGIVRRNASSPEGGNTFRPASPRSVMPWRQNGRPIPETGDQHPPAPAFAEGPESRAKTAERGAERCHINLLLRGSFQRPVRGSLTNPRARIRRVDETIAGPEDRRRQACEETSPSRLHA
jgi:hypothetical protein